MGAIYTAHGLNIVGKLLVLFEDIRSQSSPVHEHVIAAGFEPLADSLEKYIILYIDY